MRLLGFFKAFWVWIIGLCRKSLTSPSPVANVRKGPETAVTVEQEGSIPLSEIIAQRDKIINQMNHCYFLKEKLEGEIEHLFLERKKTLPAKPTEREARLAEIAEMEKSLKISYYVYERFQEELEKSIAFFEVSPFHSSKMCLAESWFENSSILVIKIIVFYQPKPKPALSVLP